MIIKGTKAFQDNILKALTFSPHIKASSILYKNDNKPELGFFKKYSRPGYYDFGIGDYKIPHNFSLSFEHQEDIIRFGTVYLGETAFKLENQLDASFTPSSFFVMEKEIKGSQSWQKDMHYYGAEITIYKKYLEEVIFLSFPEANVLKGFIANHTYHYLPPEITAIIQHLKNLGQADHLSSLYLESKILECVALICEQIRSSKNNAFSNQADYGQVAIGKNRFITLSYMDILAIQKAHMILTQEACQPPTISALSKRVFLNEQKLKAGFSAKYHMSISQYTTSLRMTIAENLLSTTELSVNEIALKVGYNYGPNFIKSFKKYHGKTPLAFRKTSKSTQKKA